MSRHGAAVRTAGLLAAFLGLPSALGPAHAQTRSPTDGATPLLMAPGAPAGSYALGDFDHVNLFNGSLLIDLPLLRIQGRGGAQAKFTLPIQRRWVLDAEPDPNAPDTPEAATFHVHRDNWDWSSPAFERLAGVFGLGQLEARHVGQGTGGSCGGGGETIVSLTRLYFTFSDGTELELVDKVRDGFAATACSSLGPPTATTWVSKDGTSSATFVSDQPVPYRNSRGTSKRRPVFFPVLGVEPGVSGVLYLRDGTRYRIDSGVVRAITDRNGNQLTLERTDAGVRIKDSLDRVYEFVRANPWLPPGALDTTAPCGTIHFSGSGGVSRAVTISCSPLADALLEGQLPPIEQLLSPEIHSPFAGITTFNPNVVTSVELPNGRRYEFRYNAYGEVVRVELPTGATIEYLHAPGLTAHPVVLGGEWVRAVYRRVVEKKTYDAQGTLLSRTTFSRPESVPDPAVPAVPYVETDHRDPRAGDALLRRERHYLNGQASETLFLGPMDRQRWKTSKEEKTEILGASGAVLRTFEHTWSQADASEFAPLNNPHIIETRARFENGLQSRQVYAYDTRNNLTDTREFDFDGQLLRDSHTDYSFSYEDLNAQPPVYILNLPVFQAVTGPGQTSETTYSYDGAPAGPLLDRPGISGHDALFGAGFTRRGNLTTLTRRLLGESREIAVERSQYDIAGNVVKTLDARGHKTDFLFEDRWNISGSPCGEPSDTRTYAFPTVVINALSQQACTRYDRDTGQAVQQRDPNEVFTELHYLDALDRLTQVIRASNQPQAKTQTSHGYDDEGRLITTTSDLHGYGDGVLRTRTVHDGLGRVVLTQQREDDGDISVVRAYDGLGRVSRVSNPFRGAQPGGETQTEYDALDRAVRVTTSQDGAATFTTYAGRETTVTDPAGKVRTSVADALGRVVRLVEGGGGESCGSPQATCYDYDALDNLTQVRQGAQTRTFAYDSLSRLKTAQNPESGTVSYVYDDNGNVTQRTDARGAVTTYSYDELDRIGLRTYALGSSGAASTDRVFYLYDQSQGHPAGRLTAVQTSTSETVFDSYDALGRVTAHHQETNGRVYETEYQYNRAGLLTSETLPSGRELTIQHDSAGRINGITGSKPGAESLTFLEPGGVRYAPHGAIEAMQLGSGRWEHTRFNSRLQPEHIGVGSSRGDSGLLGLSYGHGGANNNGNVLSQTINAGGRSFQQAYSYDALNRLESAAESRDGNQVWNQAYGHDRFGNRWVSGGYVPDLNLTPDAENDFDPSRNRIALSDYDAAGNQKRDAVDRHFDYDAENRQVTFAAGSRVVDYLYDGDGRRVMKHERSGHTWVYVYDAQGRLVTEHSDEDLLRPAKDFVHAGSRLIAEVKGALGDEAAGPVLIAPTGVVDNCAPNATFEFSWHAFPQAIEYRLRVDGLTVGTYRAEDICDAEGICVVEPQANPLVEPFAPGPHSWAVRATTASGSFSSLGDYDVVGPRPATPVSPSGALTEPPTVFTWRHSPDATQYDLRIDGTLVASFMPAQVCEGQSCTAALPSPPNLASGAHSWRIHGVFPECEVGSLPLKFSNGIGTPCGASPIYPPIDGNVPPAPFFEWAAVTGAEEYRLSVVTPDGTVLSAVLAASEVCQGNFCSRHADLQGWILGGGLHRWKVVPLGIGNEDCDGWPFTVDLTLPERPVPISPVGRTFTFSPAFRWREAARATEYVLAVEGANPNIHWLTSAICSGGVCETAPIAIDPALCRFDPDPRCSWQVIARNSFGASTWSDPLFFTVEDGDPCGTTPIYPARGDSVPPAPFFEWAAVTGAQEYRLSVVTPEGTVLSTVLPASEVCHGNFCTRHADTLGWTLGGGLHRWKAVPLGFGDESCEGWPFTVDLNRPERPVPISPSGRIFTFSPVFRWQEAARATEYVLAVEGANPNIHWLTSEICSGGVCESAPISIDPALCRFDPDPRCSWLVLARNSAGSSTWSDSVPFSVEEGDPCGTTPIYPASGGLVPPSPFFEWAAVTGAQEYRLTVVTPEGTVLSTVLPASEVCQGNFCTRHANTLGWTLGAGLHRWKAVPLGIGDESCEGWPFTVDLGRPERPVPISPSGRIFTFSPVFRWQEAARATEYLLAVEGANPNIYTLTSEICPGGACESAPINIDPAFCRFDPDPGCSWSVLARNSAGSSTWSDSVSFSVEEGDPCGTTPIYPASGGLVPPSPFFEWAAVAGAQEYRLTVVTPEGTALSAGLPASEVCQGNFCTRHADTLGWTLGAGLHRWKVVPLGIGDENCAGWPFTVDLGRPERPVAISPSGEISTLSPVFRWQEATRSTEYVLAVEGANPNIYTLTSEVCSGGVCESAPISIDLALCRFDPDPRCSWSVLARNSAGSSTWTDPQFFWVVEGPNPPACDASNPMDCGPSCAAAACDAPCRDVDTNELTTCGSAGVACNGSITCATCTQLGGTCGNCPEGSLLLGNTVDCNFQACCRTATASCEELAGPDRFCSGVGGWCPRGFDARGPSTDCASCCQQGPSCGTVGGPSAHCSVTSACPQGYDAVGPTYDCEMCCNNSTVCGDGTCTPGVEDCGTCIGDCPCWQEGTVCNASGSPGQCVACQPVGCGEGACGDQPDGCGGTIDCGPCVACGDEVCTPGVEDCGTCIGDCPCWQEGTVCNASGSPGQCIEYCGSPFDQHDHSGSCGSSDACGHGFGADTDCGCPGDNHDHSGACGSIDTCGHDFGADTDCGCPGDNHDHSGSCGSTDTCGHGFGADTDCGCPGDNHEHSGSCGSTDTCGHDFGADTDCGCPGDNHDHSGSCGSTDTCGHGFGADTDCGCPGDNHDHSGSCGATDSCGHGFGADTDCGCPGDNHDHGGSCGSTDTCGHGFGADTDCGCPGDNHDHSGSCGSTDTCGHGFGADTDCGCPGDNHDHSGSCGATDSCGHGFGADTDCGCPGDNHDHSGSCGATDSCGHGFGADTDCGCPGDNHDHSGSCGSTDTCGHGFGADTDCGCPGDNHDHSGSCGATDSCGHGFGADTDCGCPGDNHDHSGSCGVTDSCGHGFGADTDCGCPGDNHDHSGSCGSTDTCGHGFGADTDCGCPGDNHDHGGSCGATDSCGHGFGADTDCGCPGDNHDHSGSCGATDSCGHGFGAHTDCGCPGDNHDHSGSCGVTDSCGHGFGADTDCGCPGDNHDHGGSCGSTDACGHGFGDWTDCGCPGDNHDHSGSCGATDSCGHGFGASTDCDCPGDNHDHGGSCGSTDTCGHGFGNWNDCGCPGDNHDHGGSCGSTDACGHGFGNWNDCGCPGDNHDHGGSCGSTDACGHGFGDWTDCGCPGDNHDHSGSCGATDSCGHGFGNWNDCGCPGDNHDHGGSCGSTDACGHGFGDWNDCGCPGDNHDHSGSCGATDACGHGFGNWNDCGCPGDNHDHGGSCGSTDACGHGFGNWNDCGCPGDNHDHGGSCGSTDACGHGFGNWNDCGCPGDNHDHGGSCGSTDVCGHGFGNWNDCGCPGDNHDHGGSCGSTDACGHGFGNWNDCGCPGDNHDHGGSCGSTDACGHGFGDWNECGCPGDNHDHGGSCGATDACGHGFGTSTDCGCPDAPIVWDTCWQWVCDTCEDCWQECDEEGNCWTRCGTYECNCRWESYECNPHQC